MQRTDEKAKMKAVMIQDQDAIASQLNLGLEVFLDLNPYGAEAMRFRARLCGWVNRRFLIFEPANPQEFQCISKSQPCAVRFFSGGDVWGFVSVVLDPGVRCLHNLVQVQWPAKANRVRMREHDRIQLSIPCQIRHDGIEGIPAILDDLSLGGCSIRSSHLFAVQSEIHVSFQLPGCGAMEDQQVIIRNVRKGVDRTHLYGCQFIRVMNPAEITAYINNRDNRSGNTTRPQILLLSSSLEDGAAVQRAIGSNSYEVAVVHNLLELGFRIWSGQPAAIMVHFRQSQLSALESCKLIKASPGVSNVPLIVYGGSASFHDQAFNAGVDLCLDSLDDAAMITAFLGE